ncbi:efflux RND transporter periplasmic adaptor subunit [Pseudidiomarina aestuarii]|uniref:Efflux RND transporter periplasmic adaptor subunit n=1 Tax=Pseudidiomarina aestuarii TaxID=624146 RepID=A0A2T4D4W5_9GAMM|nr:efflux RND transporter periplasmic adaptor subunit [Pseudidiomarina aestuarii]PTB90253.1 efflux RND transporter periplasmic adaptor subunit [Pseudidiomarina aestuarii]
MRQFAGLSFLLFALPIHAAETTVQTSTVESFVRLQGIVESTNAATVSAQTSGRVEQVLVDIGDVVEPGATIVTITSTEQYQAVAQALAQESAAQATLVAAQREYDRVSSIVADGLLPKAELDRVEAALQNAQSQVKATQAAVTRAREQLSYSSVKAPYGGVVSERLVEPGEAVQPGTPLMSGFDPTTLRIHVDVPMTLARAVERFSSARIQTQDGWIEPTQFKLFPTVDAASASVRLRLTLPADLQLLPGQWLGVSVKTGEYEGLSVPAEAITQQGELTLVKLASGDWRAVRVADAYDGRVEILSGLSAGEVISYE